MLLAKIVEKPHLMFVGASGKKFFCITVESVTPEEECKRRGFLFRWDVNEDVFKEKKYVMDAFGLTESEYIALQAEFTALSETCAQNN